MFSCLVAVSENSEADGEFAGLPKLPTHVADTLRRAGLFPLYYYDNSDLWQWFCVNPDVLGCDWRRIDDNDELFELVLVRGEKGLGLQCCFYTFPDLKEFSTKDIYRRHPSLPNYWLYQGRMDDIIVFSNGEKFNPATTEEVVTGPLRRSEGALVVGSNRFQPALILEPREGGKRRCGSKRALLSLSGHWLTRPTRRLLPKVRLHTTSSRSRSRTSHFRELEKEQQQRASAEKLYADEIDKLYEKANQASAVEAVSLDFSSAKGADGHNYEHFSFMAERACF